jgi:zinc protease
MELLRDSLLSPDFPDDQIEKLRAQLLTSLAIRAQDTGEMASETFDEILYNGHPYSRPESGTVETVSAIQRGDMELFHHKNFGPQGMVLAIVGAVKKEEIREVVARYLGDWKNVDQPKQPEIPKITLLKGVTRRFHPIPGKSQADILLGCSAPLRNSTDYLPASLGNSVLGQFGMFGRIGEVVREKAGLAYYAFASLNCGIGPGSWEVSAGVNPANVEKTIDLVREEIHKFLQNPVTDDELMDSKANFIGRLPLMFESNVGVAGGLLNLERYKLGLDYYQKYPDHVRAVTTAQILETARRFLSAEDIAIAVAGPESL